MVYSDSEKQYKRQYYLDNRDKILKKIKEFNLKNKDYIREYKKQYFINNFDAIKDWKRNYYLNNKHNIREKHRKYYINNYSKVRAIQTAYKQNESVRKHAKIYQANWGLQKNFGLTIDDYNQILKKQNGVCAICFKKSEKAKGRWGKLYVDHCHKTGKIRGLLCNRCNLGLGHFEDSPELLFSATNYLSHWT